MSSEENILPGRSQALEPFVDKWAISGSAKPARLV